MNKKKRKKTISGKWIKLSEEEKDPFMAQSKIATAEYDIAMEKYEKALKGLETEESGEIMQDEGSPKVTKNIEEDIKNKGDGVTLNLPDA